MRAVDESPAAALVVAADEEMRILLRGLLQLHRVRVDAEADGLTEALRLLREHRPRLVVADSHLSDGSPSDLVAGARALVPGLRVILVVPASRPSPALTRECAPDVMLLKPFRIQQFAEAIALPKPPGPPGAAG
ncbi:MAG TPA: response regulator [Thermoplasmata archaeon]|nr:response regulator [Thermoplasmata archaeon]